MKIFVTTIWIWWIMIIFMAMATLVRPSTLEEIETLRYDTVTFDLRNAGSYSGYLTTLRNKLKSGVVACQLPVTQKTATITKRFVLVDLIVDDEISITLGVAVTDLYVWGYRDKYKGQVRANFVKDASAEIKNNLFKGAAVTRDLPFEENYNSIEGVAKQSRGNIELGVTILISSIKKVFGELPKTYEKEARFFLIAIQMVSEAARFKYIENQVIKGGVPDSKSLTLENSWDKISEGYHKSAVAKPPCQTFNPPLQMTPSWTVTKVSEIAPDMVLLKFKKGNGFGIEAITTEAANQW